MEAVRFYTQPVDGQVIVRLPAALANIEQLEVIVLPANETKVHERRKPNPLLMDSLELSDDLIAPAVPESDWDAH
ncbi:hypothetical protein [Marinospirillum alkaliphilum]|uniref:Uncharacterized protein n=1 Tax=Marinospirillum alkaliphilum DSM 21637 TaxID=1122209 RepID=A0A1K1V9M0_9GAMM|nr:hypothetical protein [Marinospirillum alkaliphilum]SFX21269.1 hypothetical protein SAMN02745752_00827 [Marinospirillum alkaliphilum DSM 21637]